jgi:type II secretory pathway pseudopilin PulG
MSIKNKINFKNWQSGQTLIETMVGVLILTLGISGAIGLAVYSLNASTNISKQIVAIGLAREGLEVIKNMRDTNWLRDDLENDCYDYVTDDKTADCYSKWLNPSGGSNYSIDPPSGTKDYRLVFDPADSLPWGDPNASNDKFGLDYDPTGDSGFYVANQATVHGTSEYYRKITIIADGDTTPWSEDSDNYQLLKVISRVWWRDRRCPASADFPSDKRCSITLETHLTNWKNY